MTAILLSVRPRYARALLAGTKTAEVRRRFPRQPPGITLYLYSSTPDRAVLGTVQLETIDRPDPDDVWHLYREEIEIGQEALSDYLTESESAAILRVALPCRWEHTIPLTLLRAGLGVEPAQSFRYLSDDQADTLERLREGKLSSAAAERGAVASRM